MTINTKQKSKPIMVGILAFVLLILAVVVGSLFNETRGELSSQDWQKINHPMTKQEVIEEVGRPKKRTSNKNKIKESYYENLNLQADENGLVSHSASIAAHNNVVGLLELEAALDQDAPVEMFLYSINDNNHFVCFVYDQYLVKY